MFKRIVLLAAVLILTSRLPLPALAAEDTSGTIEGTLVNGTAGGNSVADIEVRLVLLGSNNTPLTTKTDSDGKFTFSALSTTPPNTYQITLTYQKAEYSGDNITFAHGQNRKSANITIYDSTTSDASIKIKTAHTIINMSQGTLGIMVMYDFVNDTDRAYVGNLSFSLPPEATEFEAGYGLTERNTVRSNDGFIDTTAVLPRGKETSREIIYYYNMPYSVGAYTFHQKLPYPVAQYSLLVQDDNIKVASDRLSSQAPVDMGPGAKYFHLTGNNLARGETISAELSPKSSQTTTIILVASALIVLIVASFLVYRRNGAKSKARTAMAEDIPVSGTTAVSEPEDQILITEIARLDDDFAAGSIQEEDYRAQRAAKKAQLIKLLNTSREVGGRS